MTLQDIGRPLVDALSHLGDAVPCGDDLGGPGPHCLKKQRPTVSDGPDGRFGGVLPDFLRAHNREDESWARRAPRERDIRQT